jgi:hypothetical protein
LDGGLPLGSLRPHGKLGLRQVEGTFVVHGNLSRLKGVLLSYAVASFSVSLA